MEKNGEVTSQTPPEDREVEEMRKQGSTTVDLQRRQTDAAKRISDAATDALARKR